MDKTRNVNTKFWQDSFIESLKPAEKLIFIYLLTNPLTNICGVYEISVKRISYDTGIDCQTVEKALKAFQTVEKVFYIDNFIILSNFLKNQNLNPNMFRGAVKIFNELPGKIKSFIVSKPLKAFETILGYSKEFDLEDIDPFENTEPEPQIDDKKVIQIRPDLHHLQEWSKEYFHEKFINSSSMEVFDKLTRIDGYSIDDIKDAISWARNDDFWSANFLSPLKLRQKDKSGVKYIDVFTAKRLKNGQTIRNNKEATTFEELAGVIERQTARFANQ